MFWFVLVIAIIVLAVIGGAIQQVQNDRAGVNIARMRKMMEQDRKGGR